MTAATGQLPDSLRSNPRLGTWLSFGADHTVEVRTGKVELGQGILTALAQIASDGLRVRLADVRVFGASTEIGPDEGLTAGSLSVQNSGAALRLVCAEVLELCAAAAAVRLDAACGELEVRDGTFRSHVGSLTYWDLPTAEILDRDALGAVNVESLVGGVVGTSQTPSDLLARLTGAPCYIGDLRLPGQLFARVVRPPARQATLVSVDETRVRGLDDLVDVVVEGRFVAVLATREETAIRAASLLAEDLRWVTPDTLPDQADLGQLLLTSASEDIELAAPPADDSADADTRLTLTATYSRPFLAHGSIGTSTGVALWDGVTLQVWTHSQGVFPLRSDLARALGLAETSIVVRHMPNAGCYGHNGADDAAYDAAVLALRFPAKPVQVVWSRQDELGWGPLGPSMLVRLHANASAEGKIQLWAHEVWSNGHTSRPGALGVPAFLGYAHQQCTDLPSSVDPAPARGGGTTRNAVPGYSFPHVSVVGHRAATTPLRTSALRALGSHLNVFAIESFMDEMAALTDQDPLAFRLRHLEDPRGRAVLEAAADRAGWGERPVSEASGRGLGYARYKGTGAWCAVVADVEVGAALRVRRLTIAVDAGTVINPGGVVNQIEGGAIQATSWTVRECILFDRHRVTSDTWETYPILTFSEVPRVDVVLADASGQPSVGVGEASIGPTAGAIGNALTAALGLRVRTLPLHAQSIISAIAADDS